LAVVLAVYASLGLTRALTGLLRSWGLLEIAFALGFLLVVATILTQGLRVRPGGAEIAVTLGVAAAYLMVFVRIEIPEERTHLVEYGVVAVFIYEALKERTSQDRRVPVPALLAVLATSLIGVVDECLQGLLPSRVFDPRDILFNVLAAVMAVAASAALHWARSRWSRGGPQDVDRIA
jgi:hypothetical protein